MVFNDVGLGFFKLWFISYDHSYRIASKLIVLGILMGTTENYVNKGRDILSAKVLQWVLERERERRRETETDRQTDYGS